MKMFSLKIRFAVLMSIGALALVIGMGAMSMRFAEDDLLATLSMQQEGIVARAADSLDEHLKFAVDTLSSAAAAIPRELIADQAAFTAFQQQQPVLLQLFERVYVVGASGTVQATYPAAPFLLGLNVRDRLYVRSVLAGGKPFSSEPLRGRATGETVVIVAVPIVDAKGDTIAVLAGALTLTRRTFLGGLSATKLGETGYFVVATVGAEPMYVLHPDPSRTMKNLSGDQSEFAAEITTAKSAHVGLTKLEDGREALVAYRPLTMTNWVLAAVLPRAEAFAVVDHARNRTIAIAAVAAVIGLPLAWLLAWFLLRPLTRLRAEVESAAHDPQHTHLATVGVHDEVGEVALAFNAMLRDQRASDASRIASDQDRRRLVAILESSGDFVAMADVSGNLTYLNASARQRCGIALDDDLSHTSIRDCFPPWAIVRLEKEAIPAALASGIWLGETAILDVNGDEVPVDQTVIAHRNVAGKLEFFSSLLHDTSAAKEASAAMRSSEARMLSIADALPVMVAFLDRDHRYRFINSRYEDHFGVDKDHLLGKSIAEMIGEKAYQVYRPFFERAATGEAQVFEIESHAGVRPVHFLVKLIPQFDDLDHVTGFHFIHQDVTDHKVENQRLSQLARADALTGLLNRAGFESAIGDAMARSQHHLSAMALFYLDVDRFKSINDQYGHQIGDKLLRGFASRLVRAVRGADIAARLGGDEFVVIAEGLRNTEDVRSIASKILNAMRAEFELNGATLSITASIGVAVYTGEALKVEELVERADAALYRAKAAGRDRYELDERMEDFGTTSLIVTSLHGFMDAT